MLFLARRSPRPRQSPQRLPSARLSAGNGCKSYSRKKPLLLKGDSGGGTENGFIILKIHRLFLSF